MLFADPLRSAGDDNRREGILHFRSADTLNPLATFRTEDYHFTMESWTEELSPDLFWDVSPEEVDPEKHKRWLIERVVQRGRWEDWEIIKSHYSKQEICGLTARLRLDSKSANFLALFCSL